jgi:hypothetical protein
MSQLAVTYPPNLTWRHVLPRMFVLNQVLLLVGALSLHAVEVLSPQNPAELGLLYYYVWLECVGLFSLLITACVMLTVMRQGWRHMPDASHCYNQGGLFRSLPGHTKWLLLLLTPGSMWLSAWLAQQLFIAIQTSPWGQSHLPQAYPLFTLSLFNSAYGTAIVCVYEHFQDRSAVAEARERLAQKLSAETQLKLLRSQLDPHMLFNTLSNLYELIDDSPEQARTMLLRLISFLRSTLQGSRATQHALSEEFQLAADYLSLMQIRLGDRLRATLDLPDDLREASVPAMLLQPLIENAIKHGLEPRKQGGELTVVAQAHGGFLLLQVSNSGSQQNDQADTRSSHLPDDGSGFGLQYVRDRLHALYGTSARFELRHLCETDTTQVTLQLPLAQPSPSSA